MAEVLPENGQPAEALDMDVDAGGGKRDREEEEEEEEEGGRLSKRPKVAAAERSFEEERMDKLGGDLEREGVDSEDKGRVEVEEVAVEVPAEVCLGPKNFTSSVEMFDYLYKFLHSWSPDLDVNKYEHRVLLDLIKKGHTEPEKKIGEGAKAFQVRYHPTWKSRCFFVVRIDGTADDFSFRKCVDNILPLPEEMKAKSELSSSIINRTNHKHDGDGRRRHYDGGRGRGRRGGFRS